MSCAIQWVLDASEARSGVVVDGVVARDGSQSVNFSTIGLISAQLPTQLASTFAEFMQQSQRE